MKRILLIFIAVLLLAPMAYAQHPGTWSNNATLINGVSVPASKTVVGTNSSGQIVDASSVTPNLGTANSFTNVAPLTTIAESWIGPSSTAGIYFKGGYRGFGTTNPGADLDIANIVQASAHIRLSGQEFFEAGQTSTDGVSFLVGVNRSGNRQLWIVDSAAAAVNTTNGSIWMSAGTYGGKFGARATDGSTNMNLSLQPNGGNVLIGGSPVAGAVLTVTGGVSVNAGTNIVYYCNAGISAGNLCRGNGCSCVAGAWVATSLLLD